MKVIMFECEGSKKPYLAEIKNKLEDMQKVVGGYIETFPGPNGLIGVCNEEGKLHDMPIRYILFGEYIAGNCFVCRTKGSNFASVRDEDLERLVK